MDAISVMEKGAARKWISKHSRFVGTKVGVLSPGNALAKRKRHDDPE
jgi:hypothetical protein